ncbi:uncharacterized protein LOC131246276 [Magnolia sinica]|uniref:uncharacterized protein LOC131246276 n=1 Tax=Magnolia sinica TaxID=86752 RepID=UPI002657D8DD|nr:uncharacterized protein LOC131246276 [Magnolia sinica]
MDGRGGGCCVARYAGGAYVASSKVDRIMLRFRPIAPKPATGGSVTGAAVENNPSVDACVRRGSRAKRRCVRDSKRSSKKRRAFSGEEKEKSDVAFVTLPLLPETPERKESSPDLTAQYFPCWFGKPGPDPGVPVVAPQPVRPVGSWVTLERVTDTCGAGLVSLAEEEVMMRSLEEDTCPGFVTDGWDRVTWTNEAYRTMVGGDGEVVVGLVIRERVPETLRAFSCRVRVQYTCRKERNSMTVPCDVWRMLDGKGFAWRLDVKAALSLGR